MSNGLLPPNATPQEVALAETGARVSNVPILVRESWNPATCPANLLPWLAWAFSVDQWDNSWSEQEKRDVIAASVYVHKKKGTISAIDRALRPLGYLIDVKEWFEESPTETPYTFKVIVGASGKVVTADLYDKVERLINSAKNLRSQLMGITIKADVIGHTYIATAITSGEEATIYPYDPSDIAISGPVYIAAACQIIETVTVSP